MVLFTSSTSDNPASEEGIWQYGNGTRTVQGKHNRTTTCFQHDLLCGEMHGAIVQNKKMPTPSKLTH